MNRCIPIVCLKILACLTLVEMAGASGAWAQSIKPAADGTGTTITTPNGNPNQFDIGGGTRAGTNLFQSFQRFGLEQNQTANFLASPGIQNILGRVVGGNTSIINGLIQVTGSNANLFLMNPAGIVFGPNASLNVPAAFTATTANGIALGSNWFNAIGTNDYTTLTGNPSAFAFLTTQPAAIINAGNLAVRQGQALTLVGGTIVSTGELAAPGGQITVAAVPGTSFVRVSPMGSLLSLEFQPVGDRNPQTNLAAPPSLPQLLTGSNIGNATGLTLGANGRVELVGSGLTVQVGDAVVRQLSAQTATVSASQNLIIAGTQSASLQTTSDLNLLAKDTVQVRDNVQNPVLIQSGGDLRIEGDRAIDILALNHPQTPFQAGGTLSLVSDGVISGDAHFSSGGTFSVLNLAGQPGNFVSRYDPIIVSDGDVTFGDYTGASLWVQTAGSIKGGNITINAIDPAIYPKPVLILRAGRTIDPTSINLPIGSTFEDFTTATGTSPATITVNNITIAPLPGPVRLQAPGTIQTGAITSSGEDIVVSSTQGSILVNGSLNASKLNDDAGSIVLHAPQGSVTATQPLISRTIGTPGPFGFDGEVTIYADGDVRTTTINAGRISLYSVNGIIDTVQGPLFARSFDLEGTNGVFTGNLTAVDQAPEIWIKSSNGPINTTAGTLTLTVLSNPNSILDFSKLWLESAGKISTGSIFSDGMELRLITSDAIDTTRGVLDTSAKLWHGGNALLAAGTTIATGAIDSHSDATTGGQVILANSVDYVADITTQSINTQGALGGGNILIGSSKGFFAKGSFVDQFGTTASISSASPGGGGRIEIYTQDPLAIGGSSTAAAITSGPTNMIAPTQTISGSYTQGNISITVDPVYGGALIYTPTPPNPYFADLPLSWFTEGGSGTGQPPPPLPNNPPLFASLLSNGDTSQSSGAPVPSEPVPTVPSEPVTTPVDSRSTITASAERSLQTVLEQPSSGRVALKTPKDSATDQLPVCSQDDQGKALITVAAATQDYAAMIPCYEQDLAWATQHHDRPATEQALYNLGAATFAIGNYTQSINYYEQSLALARQNSPSSARQEGQLLAGLGTAYSALGEYAKAVQSYTQSLETLQRANDASDPENLKIQAFTLRNLGITYLAQNEIGKAIAYQQQSLAMTRRIHDRQGEGQTLGNLGTAYFTQGDYTQAIAYTTQALTIAQQRQDLVEQGRAFSTLGWAYYGLRDYSKAIGYHQQQLAIARQLGDRASEGQALNNLGDALLQSGKPTDAERALRTAITVWESLRAGLGSNDARKVSIFETQATTYTTLQEALVAQNKATAALEVAEQGRARAFIELLARRREGKREPGENGGAEQASTLRSQPIDRQNALAIKPPSLAEIQRLAREQKATLVEYSIVLNGFQAAGNRAIRESKLHIWVVQPDGTIAFRQVDLKSLNQSLETLVASSRGAIGVRGRGGLDLTLDTTTSNTQTNELKQLHQLLIQPIADLLPVDPNAPIIFVPHGALFLVPFAALENAAGHYLIEQHTLLTAPSIQALALTPSQATRNQTFAQNPSDMLIVGNPTMPNVPSVRGAAPERLPSLPGAEREALAIAHLLHAQALTGNRATKAQVLQRITQTRLIHLATHGLLDDLAEDVPGAIALAPSGKDDGLLSAREILTLKLNADLVVLSACDTGRGTITGDGVIGLSRSLLSAGASSVVVSLWSVPDAPTAELMTAFYRNLLQNPDKAHALRQAMLTTMQTQPNPRDWAAFTLIGAAK